ncbi:hypothetical protein DAI22_04g311601 [Oryza sativa Japonica Group]|nr:hypothetical protein DAI22_04g311601 [Oryza sativa Japonica Group]
MTLTAYQGLTTLPSSLSSLFGRLSGTGGRRPKRATGVSERGGRPARLARGWVGRRRQRLHLRRRTRALHGRRLPPHTWPQSATPPRAWSATPPPARPRRSYPLRPPPVYAHRSSPPIGRRPRTCAAPFSSAAPLVTTSVVGESEGKVRSEMP